MASYSVRVVRLVVWLTLGFGFIAFAAANWTPVAMIFGATEVTIRLPLLLLLIALAGFVAASLKYRLRRPPAAATIVAAAPPVAVPAKPHMPSEAQPIAVPPGCG